MIYPTPEEINALPDSLRRYIHDLETRCDPAGDLRTIAALREQLAGLEAALHADRGRAGGYLKAHEDGFVRERKMQRELEWIAGISQDSVIDAPEVWGAVLAAARRALELVKYDEGAGGE